MTGEVITPGEVATRAERLADRIERAGGRDVTVVAVTKTWDAPVAAAAVEAGLLDLGENYAQELKAKAAAVPGARWHFIGQLQTNKVRRIAGLVSLWQSVDRASLVDEIAKRDPGAAVLIEINLSGEVAKAGCEWPEVSGLVERARAGGLAVRGLMGVGPAGPPEAARPGFRRLVQVADELDLPIRSIGMSADLEVAVEEGSTMVRVGRDLFGPRPPREGLSAPT